MDKLTTNQGLSFTENFYRKILDHISTGVFFADRERIIYYWNKGAENLSGYAAEQMLGSSCKDGFLVHFDKEGVPLCDINCPLTLCIDQGKPQTVDVYLRHKDGHRVPVRANVIPFIDDEGEILGAVQFFEDLTSSAKMVRKINKLNKMAHIDVLTGVYNRRFLNDLLQNLWHQHVTYDHQFALLFADFNKLKGLNDKHGHLSGDKALVAVVEKLKHAIRGADQIGRWGGDEFMIILQPASRETIDLVVNKLKRKIDELNLVVDGVKIPLGVTIGYAFPDQASTLFELIGLADEDMYDKKEIYLRGLEE